MFRFNYHLFTAMYYVAYVLFLPSVDPGPFLNNKKVVVEYKKWEKALIRVTNLVTIKKVVELCNVSTRHETSIPAAAIRTDEISLEDKVASKLMHVSLVLELN